MHFRVLNGRMAAYYEAKLQQPVASQGQGRDRGISARAEWEREEMCHLLVADRERGLERFKNLCNGAIESFRISTLELLINIANEQPDDLSPEIRLWRQFHSGPDEAPRISGSSPPYRPAPMHGRRRHRHLGNVVAAVNLGSSSVAGKCRMSAEIAR